ncbi:MAG TPA: hypothetical protein VNM22_15325 [Candidatus Limnocylindrales bacterium]|nr:hypothetical protein [Candidatus Limnocylindrales bacterium]
MDLQDVTRMAIHKLIKSGRIKSDGKRNTPLVLLGGDFSSSNPISVPPGGGQGGVQTEKVTPTKLLQLQILRNLLLLISFSERINSIGVKVKEKVQSRSLNRDKIKFCQTLDTNVEESRFKNNSLSQKGQKSHEEISS